MWNTGTNVRRTLVAAAATAILAVASSSSHSFEPPELRCRSGIERGLVAYMKATMKARLRCQSDILGGYELPGTNCINGSGSAVLPGKLDAAYTRLYSRIVSSCGGASWGLLSYPGPCPDTTSFTEQHLSRCIYDISKQAAVRLFDIWYPSELEPGRGQENLCVSSVAKRAASMVVKELAVRLDCLGDYERPGAPAGVDCRGQMPPYGNGTFDERVDRAILRAELIWQAGMPAACATPEFASIGFGSSCPNQNAETSLTAFHACVFRATRVEIPVLVDLAFPGDPVCGNGILQEGEVCDDGGGNSDTTPNACRTTCVLPSCGDGTADSNYDEECDDGGHVDLDGCTATCGLEFCGDGAVNDLPNEDCDDGNTSPNDLCTDECTEAFCGDGVVCSHASCTSGPGGGPEVCDNGEENGPGLLCEDDCSGFTRSCVLRLGVTNAEEIGAITYDFFYDDADGELLGSGGQVQCQSLVTGALVSFFDNESRSRMTQSMIMDAGVTAPVDIARCNFATNDTGLAPSDFRFVVQAATDPDFGNITVNMAVTSIVCE